MPNNADDVLKQVKKERALDLETRAMRVKSEKAKEVQAENRKKKALRAWISNTKLALKAAQRNISGLAREPEIRDLVLNSVRKNCKQETILKKKVFHLINLDQLLLVDVYPKDGFNDIYLFMGEDLALFLAYLRYMQHDYGYSSRSEEFINLNAPRDSEAESQVLKHLEFHLHPAYRDQLIPGVIKALTHRESALKFFIGVLPDQKEWQEVKEHQQPIFDKAISDKIWRGGPLLKIC